MTNKQLGYYKGKPPILRVDLADLPRKSHFWCKVRLGMDLCGLLALLGWLLWGIQFVLQR